MSEFEEPEPGGCVNPVDLVAPVLDSCSVVAQRMAVLLLTLLPT